MTLKDGQDAGTGGLAVGSHQQPKRNGSSLLAEQQDDGSDVSNGGASKPSYEPAHTFRSVVEQEMTIVCKPCYPTINMNVEDYV